MLPKIISKNKININKCLILLITIPLVVCICLSLESKNYDFAEKTVGTIRKVWQKRKKYWQIAKQTSTWLLRKILLLISQIFIARNMAVILSIILVILGVTSDTQIELTLAAMVPYKVCENEEQQANEIFIDQRYKITIKEQIELYQILCKRPGTTSKEILTIYPHIKLTQGQLNRIRREWRVSGKKGRPKEKIKCQNKQIIIPKAGVKLFAVWLENNKQDQETLKVIEQSIDEYKKNFPQENFRLLNARKKTIERKWKALRILPFLGIGKLSELDYKQHDMQRVLGYSYSYSTLAQFLGELERINVGNSLRLTLAKNANGEYIYIDGHTINYWTRLKMHKGLMSMNNKVMAGSKAILSHDKDGKAIDLQYYPPDIALIPIIEKYCAQIVARTGIKKFVIDREVNSAKTARLFIENGWELICLLKASEYQGIENFSKKFCKKLDDGTIFYKATWKHWKKGDPRRFIIIKEQDNCKVYWGTPKIVKSLTAEQLIDIYRNRTELQENNIKRMRSLMVL